MMMPRRILHIVFVFLCSPTVLSQANFPRWDFPRDEKGWLEYFEAKEDKHPVEGLYQRGWMRDWSCSVTNTNGISEKLYFVVMVEEGQFYSGVIDGSSRGILSFSKSQKIDTYIGSWIYESGRSSGTIIEATDNSGVLSFSYEKPIEEIRAGNPAKKWDRSLNGCVMTFHITFVRKYPEKVSTVSYEAEKMKRPDFGSGSGIFIDSKGVVATNFHVVDGARSVTIVQEAAGLRKEYDAQIIVSDKANDLALLRITDAKFSVLPNLEYQLCVDPLPKGSRVYAFGYPKALSGMGTEVKVTDGLINALSGFDGDYKYYQMSAPIQSGNSGGPLFDENGNLVAINSSGLDKSVAENVGYSIKALYLQTLMAVSGQEYDLMLGCNTEPKSPVDLVRKLESSVVMIMCEY